MICLEVLYEVRRLDLAAKLALPHEVSVGFGFGFWFGFLDGDTIKLSVFTAQIGLTMDFSPA